MPAKPAATPAAPTATADGTPALLPSDFARIRKLIHARAGISLHEGKHAMVYGRLTRRLRETRHATFQAYLDDLEHGPAQAPEWQDFVNCLTTNLTSFFREEHHFELLAQDLRARRGQNLRIWCNAASTGEEPYTLAMVISETLESQASQVHLMCTDIDTSVLQTARTGIYDIDARGLSPERQRQHFQRGTGANSGLMRVKPHLARLAHFGTFNLIAPTWSGLGERFDIVFCRNVMIYFDAPTQRRVLERMHAAMKPGGLLYVGHSENFTDSSDLFRLRGKTVYERVGA